MSAEVAILTGCILALFLILILAELPIWLALAVSGSVGLLILSGSTVTFRTLGDVPYGATANYALLVIPMFVLMGVFASRAGLADDIFALAARATRKLPGGLAVATILACGGFSAVSGSSVATVAIIGRIAVEGMSKRGYRPNTAAAIVALGATLGVLIPPSILMVVFAILTEQSVGKLLIAGIIPGVMTMVFYMIAVVVAFKRGTLTMPVREVVTTDGVTASIGGTDEPPVRRTRAVTMSNPAWVAPRATRHNVAGGLYAGLLFAIIIGGMYAGLFTATESAAIAAATAMVILIIRRSRGGAKPLVVAIRHSLSEAASTTAMIFALMFGGFIFAYFLLRTGVPSALADSVVAAGLPPLLIIIISLVMLILLGALMDELSILLIVIPLLWPVIDALGVDGIWYGILVMKATAIGLIAPPVGINVFVAAGLSTQLSAVRIYRAILPFFLVELVVIAVLIAFPAISTFLPNLAAG